MENPPEELMFPREEVKFPREEVKFPREEVKFPREEVKFPESKETPQIPPPGEEIKLPENKAKPHKVRIAGCIMVKNETLTLPITLKSIQPYISSLIVLDTGSTDNTLAILQDWSAQTGIPLFLSESPFVDFSFSRNQLLDFADTVYRQGHKYDYLLLLDSNDQLVNGSKLLEEAEKFLSAPEKVFMVRQQWVTGTYLNKYLNSRFVKALHGWRYKKRVHEYLAPPEAEKNPHRPNLSEEVVLFQNRNNDDDKTKKRFQRDKALLTEDVQRDNDPRDIFYLAQTLGCLEEWDAAYEWYQKRGEILTGFWEERFHSYLRSGEISLNRRGDTDQAIVNFLKAAMIDCRVEPLLQLAKIYRSKNEFFLSYFFSWIATKLSFPSQNILFISEKDYSYERWHHHSIVSFYVERYSEGLAAIETAEKTGNEPEAHLQNRKFYQEALAKGAKDISLFPVEDLPPELEAIYNGFVDQGKKALSNKDPDTAILRLIQAFQLSQRIGPLLLLGEYCRLIRANSLGYWLAAFTLLIEPPKRWLSPKEPKEYSYLRYHLIGILGYHTQHYREGKAACLRAIQEAQNIGIDRRNLTFYLELEKTHPELFLEKTELARVTPQVAPQVESKEEPSKNLTQYLARRVPELQAINPKLSLRQAEAKARLEWKLKK